MVSEIGKVTLKTSWEIHSLQKMRINIKSSKLSLEKQIRVETMAGLKYRI